MSDLVTLYALFRKVGEELSPVQNSIGNGIYPTLEADQLAKVLEEAACTDSRTKFEIQIPKKSQD